MRWAAMGIGLVLACSAGRARAEEDAGTKTVPELLEDAKQRERDGRLVDALRSSRDALALAIASRDAGAVEDARLLVEDLLKRIPHVTFSSPNPAVERLQVEFDHRAVPIDSLSKTFSVDPGSHLVEAYGELENRSYRYEETIELAEGNEVTKIYLHLVVQPPLFDHSDARRCLLEAKSDQELDICLHPEHAPKGGCRSCTTTPSPLPDPLSTVVLVLFTIAGSRASSFGSRRTRDRVGGRSRTRAEDRPRS